MKSDNPEEFVKFFSFPVVRYFGHKSVARDYIIKDKERYFKDWSEREYKNIKIETVRLSSKRGEAKIKITFNYLLKGSKKEIKGVSRHILTIKEIDGKVLITKIGVAH
jgi:hypothetical protein